MDVRIARLLINSPHREEFKYLFMLPDIQSKKKQLELINLRLPSFPILCENVRSFIGVGSEHERQMEMALQRHAVPALLTHFKLVLGLTIVHTLKADVASDNFMKFLERSLVEFKRLREITSSTLFSTPVPLPSPIPSPRSLPRLSPMPSPTPSRMLRSASSVSSLGSLSGRNTPTGSPRRARARRRLDYPREMLTEVLIPPVPDLETLSQVTWRSLSETFRRGITEERRRRVTMEDDVASTNSVTSQELQFQRDYVINFIVCCESDWIGEEDAVGFGTPGIDTGRPRVLYDLASPLPTDSLPTDALPTGALPTGALPTDALPTGALPTDALPTDAPPTDAPLPNLKRPVACIVELPDETQPFPEGDKFKKEIDREFNQDAFRRPTSQSKRLKTHWNPQEQSSPKPGASSMLDGTLLEPLSPILPLAEAQPCPEKTQAPPGETQAPHEEIQAPPVEEPVPAESSGPVDNPNWAPFPIYADAPQHAQPSVVPEAQDETSNLFFRQYPLEDITDELRPRPKRVRRKRTKKLHIRTNYLQMNPQKTQSRIANVAVWKRRLVITQRVKKQSQPLEVKLDKRGRRPDPSKSNLPIVEGSGRYMPLEPPPEDEPEEEGSDMSLTFNLAESSSSWETISEEAWVVPGLPDGQDWPIQAHVIIDSDWFYYHNKDAKLWSTLHQDYEFKEEEELVFPPKFRYKRAPLLSCALLRSFPDWESRRHPSELPPEPVPQVIVEAVVEEATGGQVRSVTGATPGPLMATDQEKTGSKSWQPSALTGSSGLDPRTLSSHKNTRPSGALGRDELRPHIESVPSTSGRSVTLPTVEEHLTFTAVEQPQDAAQVIPGLPEAGTQAAVLPEADGQVPVMPEAGAQAAVLPEADGQVPVMPEADAQAAVLPEADGQVPVMPEADAQVPVMPQADAQRDTIVIAVIPAGTDLPEVAEFRFAVPAPAVRRTRVRAVQPVYTEVDDDDDEPPRRRRRRRRRRVQDDRVVSPVPPPIPEPIEVMEAEAPPPQPEFEEAEAPPMPQEEAQDAASTSQTTKAWDPDRVKAFLKEKMEGLADYVLRFSDCCDPNVCPRNVTASFFSSLLVLDNQKVISLRQSHPDGKPDGILIVGNESLFEEK